MIDRKSEVGGRKPAIILGLLAMACMVGRSVSAVGSDPAKDTESIIVLVLAAERPVLVRLQVQVNGAPYQEAFDAAWNDYLEHLFRFGDRNNDGRLGAEEAERLPAPSAVLRGGWGDDQSGFNFAFNFRVLDRNADGAVTLDELKAYYRRYAGGPFHAQPASGPSAVGSSLDRLFDRLDENRDRNLSTEELASATRQLKSLDADGDDTITESEISGGPTQATPPAATSLPDPAVIVFSPGNPPADLAEVLFSRYGKRLARSNAPTLRQKDIGLDQDRFTRLDRNQDGTLDAEELRGIVGCPPDCEISIRLGDAKERDALELTATADQAKARIGKDGCVRCGMAGAHIELLRNASKLRIIGTDADRYIERLKANAKNADGAMDRKASLQDPLFASAFDLMDRDGDGKLTEAELRAYLEQVHARHVKVLACRPAIVFSNEGRGLFDLLDQDRDGRLSLRELRDAERLPERLDANAPLTRESIPRSFRIGIGLSQASLSPHGGNMVAMPAERDLLSAGVGPIWFRKMDRNRDGDLSPNEFLGTPEDFRRLDTDGDGLISAGEAEQVK